MFPVPQNHKPIRRKEFCSSDKVSKVGYFQESFTEFFDIAKDSEAFKALELVQNTCKKDMELLQEDYEAGRASRIGGSFDILDSIAPKLRVYAAKTAMLSEDATLPVRILDLYQKMRATGMIVPKSMIQFIRDFIVGWKTHKFRDNSKDFPNLVGSVGSLAGALTGQASEADCYKRLSALLTGVWGRRRAGAMSAYVDRMGSYAERRKMRYDFHSDIRPACMMWLTAFFIYKLCGWYAYDAIRYGDEGGRDVDKDGNGVHASELRSFYQMIRNRLGDIPFTEDGLLKVFQMVDVVDRISRFFDVPLFNIAIWHDADGGYQLYRRGVDFIEDHRTLVKAYTRYDDRLAKIVDDGLLECTRFGRASARDLDGWLAAKMELAGYLDGVAAAYPEFERSFMERQLAEMNGRGREPESSDGAAKTVEEAMAYLYSVDITGVVERRYSFALTLLNELKSSGKIPSDRQFYYLKQLYERVSGKTYGGETSKPSGLTDTERDIARWAVDGSKLDDFTCSVLRTVLDRGTVSDRQRRYLERAIAAYNDIYLYNKG